jgi:hypothetical protein
MCYRVRDLERPREKAAHRHTATTVSLRSRFDERWAALLAWLRPSVKATPATATSAPQAKPTQAIGKPVTALYQASTVAGTPAKARAREAETV